MTARQEQEKNPQLQEINYLKGLIEALKNSQGTTSQRLETFFALGIEPFFSPICEGLLTTTGHLLYRLSDTIPQEERERIAVYPQRDGRLIIDSRPWETLEDWRKEWERYNPIIPRFTRELPLIQKLLPKP